MKIAPIGDMGGDVSGIATDEGPGFGQTSYSMASGHTHTHTSAAARAAAGPTTRVLNDSAI